MFGGRIGFGELILILGLALLIFGPSKLPQLGKSLGASIKEFKGAMNGTNSDSKPEEKDNPSSK